MTSLVRSLMTLLVSSSMTFSDGSKEPDDHDAVSTVNPSPDGLFMKTRQKKTDFGSFYHLSSLSRLLNSIPISPRSLANL